MKVFGGRAIEPRNYTGCFFPEKVAKKTGEKTRFLFWDIEKEIDVLTGKWVVELTKGHGNSEEWLIEKFDTEQEAKDRIVELYQS